MLPVPPITESNPPSACITCVSTTQPSGTPHTRYSLTTTLALHLQRRTWLRPGLPCVLRDPPLLPASLLLHLPVDLIDLSLQVPVSLLSGSLAHIFSFHSNPTSRAPLAQVSALLTWARAMAPEGTLTPSCPHPWSHRTRTWPHSPAYTNLTQMVSPYSLWSPDSTPWCSSWIRRLKLRQVTYSAQSQAGRPT